MVSAADYPGRRIADSEVQDFACSDELVERSHDLFDGGAEVPPVDVQLDIVSAYARGKYDEEVMKLTKSI